MKAICVTHVEIYQKKKEYMVYLVCTCFFWVPPIDPESDQLLEVDEIF